MEKQDIHIRALSSLSLTPWHPWSSESISPDDHAEKAHAFIALLINAEDSGKNFRDWVYALIYRDIYQIAQKLIQKQQHSCLSPAALVNEAWLKLARSRASAQSHQHLLSLTARAMRFVLIDEARRALSSRRGGHAVTKSLSVVDEPTSDNPCRENILDLDKALEMLAQASPRLARVVELHYFIGLKETEVAEMLGITERTVRRDWRKARAFLQTYLTAAENSMTSPP